MLRPMSMKAMLTLNIMSESRTKMAKAALMGAEEEFS